MPVTNQVGLILAYIHALACIPKPLKVHMQVFSQDS